MVPSVLDEVISVTAAMRPNCRSSGVATEEAMVSGLAPGKAGAHGDGREIHLGQRRHRQASGTPIAPARAMAISRAWWRPAYG